MGLLGNFIIPSTLDIFLYDRLAKSVANPHTRDMKNYENTAMLDHKRKIDAARKDAAIAKRKAANAAALRAVGGAK